jgi:predicted nucleic acid-binding protein
VRCVLDTDVIVAAMRSPTGASAAILRSARRGNPRLLLSVTLALEYEATAPKRSINWLPVFRGARLRPL